MFGQGANKTALTERESIERPVSPTWMRPPSGRADRASRMASWIVGSTRGTLSPGTESDHGSPPDCSKMHHLRLNAERTCRNESYEVYRRLLRAQWKGRQARAMPRFSPASRTCYSEAATQGRRIGSGFTPSPCGRRSIRQPLMSSRPDARPSALLSGCKSKFEPCRMPRRPIAGTNASCFSASRSSKVRRLHAP
jgi:hypothetical protein